MHAPSRSRSALQGLSLCSCHELAPDELRYISLVRVGTLDITRDMTRQYKGMQEELLNRINQLEGTIQVGLLVTMLVNRGT